MGWLDARLSVSLKKNLPPTAAEFKLTLAAWEGQFVEFKESISDSLAREFVAFANASGGRIYIGVTDNKKIKGVTLDNRLLSQVQDIARHCEPSLAIHLAPFKYKGSQLLMIEVTEGKQKPYGCVSGYFLRTGPTSQKLNRNELVAFVQSLIPVHFERQDCPNFKYPKDFNGQSFQAFLKAAGIASSGLSVEELLINLSVAKRESSRLLFNNTGVLFFAKEPACFLPQARVTCVLFQTPERLHILDRKDLSSGLLENLEQAEIFLMKHLPVRYEIRGFNRIEHLEFPIEVLREGLVNALMHRDYSVSGGNVFIEIYPDRLTIVNPGGLPPGLSKEDFGKKSIHRNALIADLFFRAGKVEKVGTGIERIRNLLAKANCGEPEFRFTSFFDLILPRIPIKAQVRPKSGPSQAQVKLSELEMAILKACTGLPLSSSDIAKAIRHKALAGADKKALRNLLEHGYLARTLPKKPQSRFQKYFTTKRGVDCLPIKIKQ